MPSVIRNPRRSPRVPIRLSAEVAHRDEIWTTETENVGPGGCSMLSPRPLVAHAPLRVTLRTDLLPEALRIQGSVAWVAAGRGGIAFERARFALGPGPDAWFKLLVAAQPQLSFALQRMPEELLGDAPVYLAQPRRARMAFTPDEATLVANTRQGMPIEELLGRSRFDSERGARALFTLLERGVLTLSMGEAGEAWRWKAVLDPSAAATPRPVAPLSTYGRGARQRARAWELTTPPVLARVAPRPATPDEPRSLAPPLPPAQQRATTAPPRATAAPAARGASPRSAPAPRPAPRSAAVQQQLDSARVAVREGRERDAMKLLRSAQVIAPHDAEIAQLLGELSTRNKILG